MFEARQDRQLGAIRRVVAALAERLAIDAHVELWDGSRLPLGPAAEGPLTIRIASPAAIGAMLRRPTLETVIGQYVEKQIDITGGTLRDLGRQFNREGAPDRLRPLELARIALELAPFLTARGGAPTTPYSAFSYMGDFLGRRRKANANKDYVQFHYDLSNDFYGLFLDAEMVYSCAYFRDWSNGIEEAQRDKLDMICRKLRLKPGDRLLDIGCGWGGLVCHAASAYGASAHGITLSERQLQFARAKVERLGLAGRISIELADYASISGRFDKIASIGMYEHIGRKNIPAYMSRVRSLLADDGLFLNHAISLRAPKSAREGRRLRPEQRAIAKYIFPGGELDDIGHTVWAMERAGFEVQDVEAWRMHYARTLSLWAERLRARQEEAARRIGEARTRIWLAYLDGCGLAFERGTLRIYQTLVSKSAKRPPKLPPTRADLYS
jgi:cyclopropane-fatty-acyl-phospholipid synthase